MKLLDYILFSMALGLFVVGTYEAIVLGIGQAYWMFMLSLSLLFLFGYRKNVRQQRKP